MTHDTSPENPAPPAAEEGVLSIPQWSRTTRLLAVIGLIIAAVYALTLIAPVMQMLAFAFLLTFVMYAPTRWASRRLHLPWALSVVLMYLLLIVIIAGGLLIVIPNVVSGINTLIVEGEQAFTDLRETLRDYTPEQGILTVVEGVQIDFDPVLSPLRRFMLGDELVADTLPEGAEELEGTLLEPISLQQLLDGMSNIAGSVTGTVTSAITTVTGFVGTLLLAIFVSFLILLDWPKAETSVQYWVTEAYRHEFQRLTQELLRVWNGFFRGQVAIGGIVGVVTWLQLTLMGINGAEILALLTGVISLIPTLGGIISLIPLGLTALLRGSTVFESLPFWTVALLVIGVNMVLNQIIWNVAAPLILGDALDLPLPVIVVGVFIGAAVGGILGAFLVAPIMGTLRVLLEYAMHKIRQEDPFPPEPPPPAPRGRARPARSGA